MTEQEWLTCDYPVRMVEFGKSRAGRLWSGRKMRLFASACMRMEAERYDLANETDRSGGWHRHLMEETAERCEEERGGGDAYGWSAAEAWARRETPYLIQFGGSQMPARAAALRDIVGNPFCPAVALPRDIDAVLEDIRTSAGRKTKYRQKDVVLSDWITPDVVRIARSVYDERDFGKLPVLADALEEAGCAGERVWLCGSQGKHSHNGPRDGFIHGEWHTGDPRKSHHHHDRHCLRRDETHPLLVHLRSPGRHFLGCWAVDCVLGLE